jgi:acrylyl-CoA reductase (NADPH)
VKFSPGENFSWAVFQDSPGNYELRCVDSALNELSPGQLLIRIEYSSLNYKDVLSLLGKNGESKVFPQVIGVDLVGIVIESLTPSFQEGVRVAQFSRGLGTIRGGGIARYITSDTVGLITVPKSISPELVMALGTAGLTAAACVSQILEAEIDPSSGPILITGAGGGVGKITLLMLSRLGYQTIASSRECTFAESNPMQVIPPLKSTHLQLLPEKWIAVVDTLGGDSLATAIKSTRRGGMVFSVGNVKSNELKLTVFPFILRGVRLIGVNLDSYKLERIQEFLSRVSGILDEESLMSITKIIEFNEVPDLLNAISEGKHSGRTVVRIPHSS